MAQDRKVKIDTQALLEQEARRYELENEQLKGLLQSARVSLKYEHDLRMKAEQELRELKEKYNEEVDKKRKRRTKAEMEELRSGGLGYSEYKSNGVKKKTKVDSIRSYTDMKRIQDYFLDKGFVNYYAAWTVGVCMGVRASDLCDLKWINILEENMTFKERIKLYEHKTGKLQNCLITEAMKEAFVRLLDKEEWKIKLSDYVFKTEAAGTQLTTKRLYRVLTNAANDLKLDFHLGTHSMRNSFANIVLCVDKQSIDMSSLTKVQGLLNHSDVRVTMQYLGTLGEMYDRARMTVSDFVLGKAGVDKLVCGVGYNTADIAQRLDEIAAAIAKGDENSQKQK